MKISAITITASKISISENVIGILGSEKFSRDGNADPLSSGVRIVYTEALFVGVCNGIVNLKFARLGRRLRVE